MYPLIGFCISRFFRHFTCDFFLSGKEVLFWVQSAKLRARSWTPGFGVSDVTLLSSVICQNYPIQNMFADPVHLMSDLKKTAVLNHQTPTTNGSTMCLPIQSKPQVSLVGGMLFINLFIWFFSPLCLLFSGTLPTLGTVKGRPLWEL